jgi:RNA polymerase sigma-70 factor (sigma-E family)
LTGEARQGPGGHDFETFYSARKDAVLRAVLAATGDHARTEDAVAEAFTRAYADWDRVRRHANPTAWVMPVALNAHRSWWRRLRRERSGTPPDRPSPGPAQDGVLDDPLRAPVAQLPGRQRSVLALRVLADLSAEETGELLGIAPATVHVHLHRAIGTLRARLETVNNEEVRT